MHTIEHLVDRPLWRHSPYISARRSRRPRPRVGHKRRIDEFLRFFATLESPSAPILPSSSVFHRQLCRRQTRYRRGSMVGSPCRRSCELWWASPHIFFSAFALDAVSGRISLIYFSRPYRFHAHRSLCRAERRLCHRTLSHLILPTVDSHNSRPSLPCRRCSPCGSASED